MRFAHTQTGVDTENAQRRLASGALYEHSRRIALGVVAGQVAIALALATGLALMRDGATGYSALVGAGIGILPTYYFTLRTFRPSTSPQTPGDAVRNLYLGESIKVVFTLALFVLVVLTLEVRLSMVAVGYVATVAVNWIAVYCADLGESPS